jgi:hypothetical protein
MNYTELFDTIKSYCENDFAASVFTGTDDISTVAIPSSEQVNTFIKQAEQRIYNAVSPPALRKNVYGQTTTDFAYLNLPLDFLSVYSLAVLTDTTAGYNSPQSYLLNKDPSFIRQAYPDPTATGVPEYYALFGPNTGVNVSQPYNELTLLLGPTPDAGYIVELHYFHYPESIVTSGTTWLGDNFDSVLLYGSLMEAITFMKGEQDLVALYKGKYDEAMMLYKQLGDGKEKQDAYRSGQVRVPVT